MSSQPPLSDNPYDNYIKEKLAPPKPEQAARERCSNVYDALMACLMKSKCAVSGGSLRTCVAANDLEPECVNLRHMLYQCQRTQLDMRSRFKGNRWDIKGDVNASYQNDKKEAAQGWQKDE